MLLSIRIDIQKYKEQIDVYNKLISVIECLAGGEICFKTWIIVIISFDSSLLIIITYISAVITDVYMQGASVADLKGGVAGGSILQGVLKVGDEIEVRPGVVTRDPQGRVKYVMTFL